MNPDATLAKTLSQRHLLREKHRELAMLDDHLPVSTRILDPNYYDDDDPEQQLLGKGTPVVASTELLSSAAQLICLVLNREDMTKAAVQAQVPHVVCSCP